MRDPYQVLGVSRDSSEEEIKKAYKALSRKYHPDANINNPNKDQAEEMFKEIQQAYQQIMKERTEGYRYQGGGSYSAGGGYGTSGGNSYGGFGDFGDFFGGFGGFGSFMATEEVPPDMRRTIIFGRQATMCATVITRRPEPFLTICRRVCAAPDGIITAHWLIRGWETRYLPWNMPREPAPWNRITAITVIWSISLRTEEAGTARDSILTDSPTLPETACA